MYGTLCDLCTAGMKEAGIHLPIISVKLKFRNQASINNNIYNNI